LKKKLPYDFVDAAVLKLDISKGKRLRIKVKLYKMFNPKEEVLTLVFNGVKETQRIFDLSRGVHQSQQKEDWTETKVKSIAFDAITEQTDDLHYFYIEVEGVKGEKISCDRYSITLEEPNQK
jgi:hypothetical protein